MPPLRLASIFSLGFRRRLEILFQIFLELLEHIGSHVARSPAYRLPAVDRKGRDTVRAVGLVARHGGVGSHRVGTRHVYVIHHHRQILARVSFHGGIEGDVGARAGSATGAGEHLGQHHTVAAFFGGLIGLHVDRIGEALVVFRVQHRFQTVQRAVVTLLVESFEGLVGGVGGMAAETRGDQVVHRLVVVARLGGHFAEGGCHSHIGRRDGVGFFQQFLRFGGMAEFHFHPAQRGDADGTSLGETPGQLLPRGNLLFAFGVCLPPLGDPHVLAHRLHALPGVAFGVFEKQVRGGQLVGNARGGAAPAGRGDEHVFPGSCLIAGGSRGEHCLGCLANALLLFRHLQDQRAQDLRVGEGRIHTVRKVCFELFRGPRSSFRDRRSCWPRCRPADREASRRRTARSAQSRRKQPARSTTQ